MQNYIEHFRAHIHENAFLEELETEKKWSFEKLDKVSNSWAKNLEEYSGKIISAVLPNSIEFIALQMAAHKAGVIWSPVPYFIEKQEFEGSIYSPDSDMKPFATLNHMLLKDGKWVAVENTNFLGLNVKNLEMQLLKKWKVWMFMVCGLLEMELIM